MVYAKPIVISLAILVSYFGAALPAQAQGLPEWMTSESLLLLCMPPRHGNATLKKAHGEKPSVSGISLSGSLYTLYESAESWSLVRVDPEEGANMCFVAVGEGNWHRLVFEKDGSF